MNNGQFNHVFLSSLFPRLCSILPIYRMFYAWRLALAASTFAPVLIGFCPKYSCCYKHQSTLFTIFCAKGFVMVVDVDAGFFVGVVVNVVANVIVAEDDEDEDEDRGEQLC
ncbi:hypothetical protein BX616_002820 [Lobosporangium transversale]|nr:hypothetical protein BX616_002820 [Lobosporangium transversale]